MNNQNLNQNTHNTQYFNDTSVFIPPMSFITTFSNFFIDRHGNRSTNVSTALFSTSFTPPYYVLNNLAKDRLTPTCKKHYTIIFVDDSVDQHQTKVYSPDLKVYVMNLTSFGVCLRDESFDIEYTSVIFANFKDWGYIVSRISYYFEITISGGDISRRHLLSDHKIRLFHFLSFISQGNLSVLRATIVFNVNKEFIAPKYNHVKKNKTTNGLPSPQLLDPSQKRSFHTTTGSLSKDRVRNTSSHKLNNLYKDLKVFLSNNPINTGTQMTVEKYLVDYAYTSSNAKTILGIDTGLLNKKMLDFLLPYEKQINKKISIFVKKKDSYNEKKEPVRCYLADVLSNLTNSHISSIIFGRFLRIVSNDRNKLGESGNVATKIMIDIAKNILREYFHVLYNSSRKDKNENYSFSDWRDDNHTLLEVLKEPDFLIKIGGIIVEWMKDIDLIHDKCISTDKDRFLNVFSITDSINQQFSDDLLLEAPTEILNISNTFITLPMRLPMICKPKLYSKRKSGYSLGGYLLNDVKFTDDIILSNHEFKESSRVKSSVLYNMINNINSVGYKINIELLNFIIGNPFYYTGELLESNNPLLQKTKLTRKEKVDLQKYLSKLDLQQNILNIADTFSVVPEFFFVNRLDSRGRLYCITEYLNYQGSDLAKALLLFSKPSYVHRSDVTSLNYLKIYGANCYGNKLDKLSIKKKLEWVDFNLKKIVNFTDGELIKQADNKFLFTAFCLEFNRWLEFYEDDSLTYFMTYLPIQLDATCNGFQHLALLGLDSDLSKELNLTESTFYDNPKDFYAYLVTLLLREFERKLDVISKLEENSTNEEYLKVIPDREKLLPKNKESYLRLYSFNIHRKLIKKAIMTIPYNATNRTLVNYIIDSLRESKDDQGNKWYTSDSNSCYKLSYNDIKILVEEIRDCLKNNFHGLTRVINYLDEIAVTCTKLGLYIPWLLPSGLEVRQSYLSSKSIQIKPFTYTTTKFSIRTYLDNYDKEVQVRAFMPNLIHSLDGCTLALLLDEFFKSDIEVKNIYTIHDCFAMSMNNVEYVIELLKIIYIKLYSDTKYLEKLDIQILNHIKNHFGEKCFDAETREITVPDINPFTYPNIKIALGKELDFNSLKKSAYILK